MKLKSFGCSFIFGSDLHDDGFGTDRPTPSQYSWPALIAKRLNLHYECYARPGAGNLQIMEQILNQCAVTDESVFAIGWTWIDRFDHYDANWIPKQSLSPWKTIMPIDTTQVAETYYRYLHSEYKDKFSNLVYIKTVIDTLLQKKIPFVMTYMDRLLFDQRWHVSPAVLDLQKSVEPHMTLFDSYTFLEYSKAHGFEISKQMHPLEPAHAGAAEVIWPVFDKQKTNVLTQPVRI